MAQVTFQDIAKRYGDVSIIEGLNLEIKDHEFMVLVGPSGCGKSTALRMIAGLEEISSGKLSIADRVVNDLPPKDRDVAMVFQNYALYPHMTVRENMEFGLKIRKTPKEDITRMVNDAAKLLAIDHLLDRKPKQLSGGQRQRVALGRAIVRKPAVFLFDEPLSNLDAKLRVQMRAEIKKLQHRLQVTSVYVTHDQIEAMTMGHRIAVMKEGKLQQVGTPLDVYDRPANLFVAQFIGTPPMNFLNGRLEEDGARVSGASFSLPIPPELRAATQGKGGLEVVVGIRPEHLHHRPPADRGPSTELSVPVELVEPVGDEVVVHAKLGEDSLVFKLDPHQAPETGQSVPVHVQLGALHLFDGKTEKRLGA
ncbi:MAG TPA: sn-glycerol-3-phosphate ABC transporter ATP-binding protein UgpC [Myxococcales bacterium]|nr:sn-glycerol-3-phosphate ABC transporter ATP-binding protein UgpC [Myxococcales bacterium]